MNSTGSLPEQVHALRQQVSRLETSNSKVLKLLNVKESSEKLLEKKWTDVQNKIGTLEKHVETGDDEIKVLKENVFHLKGRVEELSRIVQGAKLKHRSEQTERRKLDSDEPKITIHKLEKSDVVRNGASSKAPPPRTTLKLEATGTTEDKVSKQVDIRNVSSKHNTKEKDSIPKSPIKSNHLGLRGRTISFDVDNRVRLLQGVSIEKGNSTPSSPTSSSKNEQRKEEEKWNLPTREDLQQKKIKEAKKAEASSKPPSQRRPGTKNEYKNLAGVSKDPNAVPALVDIETWKNMAEVQRLVGLGIKDSKRGVGPDTCLLLDTSGSMEGANFEEMITIAKTFIQGIAGLALAPERSENIGIATFGEQTRVVQHLTNDFSKLLETLDLLSPAGPSPMSAGLYMALACCLGRGKNTSLVDVPVPFRIILISDGKGTPDIVSSGEDDFPVNLETTVMKHIWLNETITHFENRRGVVYCIDVGDTENEMMDELCKRTHGKMFKPDEVQKLIHMTNNTTTAINLLDRNVDFQNITELDKIKLKLMGVRDVNEVVRLGEYYYEQSNEKQYFREFRDTDVPPVGARVRRGPDWKYENQDQNGPGTIIAHAGHTSVWVVWDCESRNRYQCSPETATEVVVVDEPRALKDQLIAVGCLVVRGEDWRDEDEDGGRGNVGVVLDVKESGLILVRWPNTSKRGYKYGCEGFFEVKLCDPKKVKGTVGQLKTHVWGSGNILEPPQDDGAEGATASIIPSSESADTKLNQQIIEDEGKRNSENIHVNSLKAECHWTIEDMNKRNSQMKKAKTIEIDQTERTATPDRQMIVHWAYKKEDSWSQIPLEISSKMEKAYGRNKQGSVIVELEGNIWRANFSDMKIKCEKTRTITDIQRTCNAASE